MESFTHLNGNQEAAKIKKLATSALEDGMDEVSPYLKKAKELAGEAAQKTTDLVKAYPGYTVLGAAAVGFVAAAYIFRRRSH